jgi:hypothetical protein
VGLTGGDGVGWMKQARPPHKRVQGAPDWEDPTIFERRRLPAHVPLHSFTDPTQARLFWQQHKGSAAARYPQARADCPPHGVMLPACGSGRFPVHRVGFLIHGTAVWMVVVLRGG